MKLRLALAALAAGLLAALAPAVARAHGDIASDWLTDHDVFFPIRAHVPPDAAARLSALVRLAGDRGYRIKVAEIATASDLGARPEFFGRPQAYALFLGEDISNVYRGPVLVVMPAGYGFYDIGHSVRAARRSLAGLPKPADVTSAAIPAVQRVAAAAGYRLGVPKVAPPKSTRTRDRITIAIVALAAAAVFGGISRARRRVAAARS